MEEHDHLVLFKQLYARHLTFISKSLGIRAFADNFSNLLPLIVCVADGYCSFNEHDFNFSSEEVYRISHALQQKRVVLQDEVGQLLSFPEDHQLRFQIVNTWGEVKGKAQTLAELLTTESFQRSGKLKIKAEVGKDGHCEEISFYAGADSVISSSSLGILEIVDVYDEKYLVGNAIFSDEISDYPMIIPLWLRITVNVVDGMRNVAHEDFQQFVNELGKLCAEQTNVKVKGNKEIMVFEGRLSDYAEGYDTIKPGLYVQPTKNARLKNYENVRPDVHKKYENVIPNVPEEPKSTPYRPPRPSIENVATRKPPPPIPNKSRTFSVKDTRLLKLKDEPMPLPEPKPLTQKMVKRSNTIETSAVQPENGRNVQRQCSDESDLYLSQNRKLRSTHQQPFAVQNSEQTIKQGFHQTKEIYSSSIGQQLQHNELLQVLAKRSQQQNSGNNITQNSAQGASSKKTIQQNYEIVEPSFKNPDQHKGVNQVTQLMMECNVKKTHGHSPQTTQSSIRRREDKQSTDSSKSEQLYYRHSDVQKPVSQMSVDEITEVLKLLKLFHHSEAFVDADMDGELLSSMDENILVEEFNFSNFEAKKLLKFVSGWRSRQT